MKRIWCDFDCASSLICGNKMPTRCNRGFHCRSYCLLNSFRAPLCPPSGAQEYYTVIVACGIWCRSYCLLNMFRAPLYPSSGAQEYYTVVDACGISCCDFQVAGLVWSWGLCVRFAGYCSILQTGHIRSAIKTSVASSWHFISTY